MKRLAASVLSAGAVLVLACGAAWAQNASARPSGAPATAPAARPPARPAPGPARPAVGETVVLGNMSSWRIFHALKPPVIRYDDGPRPVKVPLSWLDWESPEPPAGWQKSDFEDGEWLRGPLRCSPQSAPSIARICIRGRFEVTDPAAVEDLKVTVAYHGGAVVSVNGQEIARGHLAKDAALAEAYPEESSLSDGKMVPGGWQSSSFPKSLAARQRKLEGVAVPAAALRKGVNVLAVEIVRAPYHKVVDETGSAKPSLSPEYLKDRGTPYALNWATCEVQQVSLSAGGKDGLALGAGRAGGLHAWNADVLDVEHDTDMGDRLEPLRPISITGARGGSFSGKVVLGSAKAIAGLKVTATDLKADAGPAIPASAVKVRYGIPWGRSDTPVNAVPRNATHIGALNGTPLAEFPLSKAAGAAVAPVWVTVSVPSGARTGIYAGELRIEAAGENPITVPLKLDVQDWTVPSTQHFRTWVELVESPDTEALEYDLEMWSPRHMEKVGKAMELIGAAGSRTLHIPLVCFTNYGASESLVRWVRKGRDSNGAGKYEFDFTILEQYLDLAEKNMGKPRMIILSLWDAYFRHTMTFGDEWWNRLTPEQQKSDFYLNLRKRGLALKEVQAKYGPGAPAVTVVDPETSKVESDYMPPYAEPASKANWTAMFKELRERLKKRGLQEAMHIGMLGDDWPAKEEVAALHEITGGLPWVSQSHNLMRSRIHDIAPVDYVAHVWSVGFVANAGLKRVYGWSLPRLVVEFRRFDSFNAWPPTTVFHWAELNITGDQRGIGRCGGDMWPVIRDKNGQRAGRAGSRYPQSQWRNLEINSYFLAPGPDGPVATNRHEVFRLGLQEAEARISIERALIDPALKEKLGADLVRRCEDVLAERTRYMVAGVTNLSVNHLFPNYTDPKTRTLFGIGSAAGNAWFISSGWQQRSARLFALAGEVDKKVGR